MSVLTIELTLIVLYMVSCRSVIFTRSFSIVWGMISFGSGIAPSSIDGGITTAVSMVVVMRSVVSWMCFREQLENAVIITVAVRIVAVLVIVSKFFK